MYTICGRSCWSSLRSGLLLNKNHLSPVWYCIIPRASMWYCTGPYPFAPVVVSTIVTIQPRVFPSAGTATEVVRMYCIGGNASGSLAQYPSTPNLVVVVTSDVPKCQDAYMIITRSREGGISYPTQRASRQSSARRPMLGQQYHCP